jgi:hypothetical protein
VEEVEELLHHQDVVDQVVQVEEQDIEILDQAQE